MNFGEILLRGILFPHTRRENVLVALIPTSIDDFSDGRVITYTFKIGIGKSRELVTSFSRPVERIIRGTFSSRTFLSQCRSSRSRLGGVIEDWPVEAENFVRYEIVKVVMLSLVSVCL